jgi:redox-sensing transcriptional repressor
MYLNYLKAIPAGTAANISATRIAEDLRLNDVQVRKDLAMVGQGGRPKIGYFVQELILGIEHCLGYDNVSSAVLIGAGDLGQILLAYEGFSEYGLDIAVVFDEDESITGTELYGKKILPLRKLPGICSRLKIKMGIIAVSAKDAQGACDLLVESGILAIWNFAPIRLNVPGQVYVQNENISSSLAVLTNHINKRTRTYGQ